MTSVAQAGAQARSRADSGEPSLAQSRPRDGSLTAPNLVSLAALDPALLPGDGLDTLQRTAGNRAVLELLDGRAVVQRQPKADPSADEKAKAKAEAAKAKADAARARKEAQAKAEGEKAELKKMYFDDISTEVSTRAGGPFTDYADYKKKYIKPASFLGHSIANGVRPDFKKMLDTAKTKIDKQYADAKKTPPADYGITSIGGFREEVSPHGAGVAIDIDGGKNPYVMHQAGTSEADKETLPVYKRIAEFILNDPIDGDQSIIPRLIKTGANLPNTVATGRAERVAQYWDRLKRESDAMIQYFSLMKDDAALKAFMTGDWKTRHPNANPDPIEAIVKQMWQDYAILGGTIPKDAPESVASFTVKGINGRPFRPFADRTPTNEPGAGFLTIPREVAVGLGEAVPRWGAIDFGGESGDVMHFDDKDGLGKPFYDAAAATDAKWKGKLDEKKAEAAKTVETAKAAKEAAAAKAAGGSGAGSGAPQLVPQRDVQRRKEPGEGSSEGGVYSDGPAEPAPAALTAAQRLSGAHWKKIADDSWGGATPNIAELESSFGADLTKFLDMLGANNITYSLESGFRPPQRSYLFHYCVMVAKGSIAPNKVPAMDGVDIVWDHGNAAASRAGAQALADAFGLVGVAAHPSNHNAGTAVDMKLDFSANPGNKLSYTVGGNTITRTIKTSDEARIGVSAKGKSISGIGGRELSKAGADFGVKRAVDNDIVHWSRTGN
jgi:hypothetical protein